MVQRFFTIGRLSNVEFHRFKNMAGNFANDLAIVDNQTGFHVTYHPFSDQNEDYISAFLSTR
jgi:hypothetical protein